MGWGVRCEAPGGVRVVREGDLPCAEPPYAAFPDQRADGGGADAVGLAQELQGEGVRVPVLRAEEVRVRGARNQAEDVKPVCVCPAGKGGGTHGLGGRLGATNSEQSAFSLLLLLLLL
eukprot:CAMPEP_0175123360 /NCGR_PEP_ID=MMETSP0087-20121206/2203_1 /TAXON_ID=136419 /ORGANISM="Unknown Unknown, Strain D1" /LENGTH=117 /DNA_ID=CAMNT_0016405049 /DNA_START=695 /DNA_END=1045 /DNA_ORIENTATION=+